MQSNSSIRFLDFGFVPLQSEGLVRTWEVANQILVPVQKVIEYLTSAPDYIFVDAMVFYHGSL